MDAATAEDEFERAIERAKAAGYSERDGRWETPDGRVLDEGVDPLPIQRAAIELAFKRAADEPDFDVFTEVNPGLLSEGNPFERNFRVVMKELASKTDDYTDWLEREAYRQDIDLYEAADE